MTFAHPFIRNAVLAAGLLALHGWASAQQIPSDLVPAKGPKLGPYTGPRDIKPLGDVDLPFFSDIKVKFELGQSQSDSNDPSLPSASIDGTDATVMVSSRLGSKGFGAVSVGYVKNESDSQIVAFPLQLTGNARQDQYMLTLGYTPLDWLAVGGFYGKNSLSGSYQFVLGGPPTDTTGDTDIAGAFVTAFLPYQDWLFSAGYSHVRSNQQQNYGNGNTPPSQQAVVDVDTLSVGANYNVGNGWLFKSNLASNFTDGRQPLPTEPALDKQWFTLGLGVDYKINSKWTAGVNASTWLANSKTDYSRVGVSLVYSF
ncbi:porin [Limnobacter humi]|uniref:Porin n=1 Tax=Limnobacter humi TaxID=1778671 RepID=A0ABT1WHP8_9BURK|nr:porin [Limnobacter humi]MCQ8897028.1 porin [Limnobacter humi]